jgi:1,4-dihydroxy-2-naphthoate octaprenyltransferase
MHAIRPRTLPLALSSTLLGSFVAYHNGAFDLSIGILACLTTLFLQMLSNLANDFGDSSHGVDNQARLGPARAVQSGVIGPGEMKAAIGLFVLLSLVSGASLIYLGTKGEPLIIPAVFFLLGISAVAAAIRYTVGRRPYGYIGLGDVFVFIFFGLAGVIGTYFLHTHAFNPEVLLPATAMGLLSTGVLNLNNLRDRENDRKMKKYTLVVIMGFPKARWYHLFLLAGSVVSGLLYMIINYRSPWQMLFLVTIPLLWMNFRAVFNNVMPEELDPCLKKLSLTSLLFTLAFGIGLML